MLKWFTEHNNLGWFLSFGVMTLLFYKNSSNMSRALDLIEELTDELRIHNDKLKRVIKQRDTAEKSLNEARLLIRKLHPDYEDMN